MIIIIYKVSLLEWANISLAEKPITCLQLKSASAATPKAVHNLVFS